MADAPSPLLRPLMIVAAVAAAALLLAPQTFAQSDIPRTPSGRPDLSGTYDIATLTPTERPPGQAEKTELSEAEAKAIAQGTKAFFDRELVASDPDREAPPVGGDVGGYNLFWLDPGSDTFQLDGEWRTSILIDPPNGRFPPMTEQGEKLYRARLDLWDFRSESGATDAFWLDKEVGPYDDPELRPFGDRCLLGFGSPAGPPVLPVVYNNLKRIVQTESHVMILAEMVHDARIVRIGGEHSESGPRKWLGESIGHWEGDTLVVETRNFMPARSGLSAPGFRQQVLTSADLRVVERFSRIDNKTLRYEFTVEDPQIWTAPWSGEYPWPATDARIFEYACHEGNYALGNIMRGARILEKEALEKLAAEGGDSDPDE